MSIIQKHEMRNKLKNIYTRFSSKENTEAYMLLNKRWKINNLDPSIIKNKETLDVGSGSGRYAVALKKMGAKEITATDIYKKPSNWPKNIKYVQSDIQSLPFKDNSFDFVFCNGSISHNTKWKSAIKEYKRVLRPNGWLWLSLFGKGNHWQACDAVKKNLSTEDAKNFEKALLLRDWEPGKIFFLLDLFFVDRVYFTKSSIDKYLKKIRFKKIKYLRRGFKTDLSEKIFHNPKLKKIYGEGEIRLIAMK